MVELKGLLTNPFDYFVYHVKTINILQFLADSKQVHQLSKKILLCQENLERKKILRSEKSITHNTNKENFRIIGKHDQGHEVWNASQKKDINALDNYDMK